MTYEKGYCKVILQYPFLSHNIQLQILDKYHVYII
ncbi:hypothetical protein SAMN04489757_10650 [Anaerocolumna aminovalerica]|uniref:Uncharacterized protein n=1 Tax=Anaerocolumna aminovalerica TaxID=1527 RepID=A0A1I5DJY3_9FIRM|nr:hypothetical protein SAMN04489757_10650 [Anaerocolumna aminovalerica]